MENGELRIKSNAPALKARDIKNGSELLPNHFYNSQFSILNYNNKRGEAPPHLFYYYSAAGASAGASEAGASAAAFSAAGLRERRVLVAFFTFLAIFSS